MLGSPSPSTASLSAYTGSSALCTGGQQASALTLEPSQGISQDSSIPPGESFLGAITGFYRNVPFPAIFIFVLECSGCAKVPAHFLPEAP